MLEATLHFDGGIRKGQMAYGWIIESMNSQKIIASGNKTCGNKLSTSNIAEYRALIAGLHGCLKAGVNIIHIIGDSQLVVKQVTGAFKVNKKELKKHCDRVLELLDQFEGHSIKWVPRRENKQADALVNQVFERRNRKCTKRKKSR